MKNLDTWMIEYEKQLAAVVLAYPDEYCYPVSAVPAVALKMRAAIERGSYNKDGRAIKATCKALGVKYTYAGIKSYLYGLDMAAIA